MKQIKLQELVGEKGLADAAKAIGTSAPAIHKALRLGREIYVTRNPDGTYKAHEVRPFPSQPKRNTP